MKIRPILLAILVPALTNCGVIRPSQGNLVQINATSRECTRSLNLSSSGFVQSGASVSFKKFAGGRSFSDEHIDVKWTVVRGSLHAEVTNKSASAISVDEITVLSGQQRVASSPTVVEPHSSRLLPLLALHEINGASSRSSQLAPVQLRTTAGRVECSYSFQLDPGTSNSRLQRTSARRGV